MSASFVEAPVRTLFCFDLFLLSVNKMRFFFPSLVLRLILYLGIVLEFPVPFLWLLWRDNDEALIANTFLVCSL